MIDRTVVENLRYEPSLANPKTVCGKLGLLGKRGSYTFQANGLLIRCVWHDDRSPSCSVRLAREGFLVAKCHGCGATGDVYALIAAVHNLDKKVDFRRAFEIAAEMAGRLDLLHDSVSRQAAVPIARPEPVPERDYPPKGEVAALWLSCKPASHDSDVKAWLAYRGLNPNAVDGTEVARSLPPLGKLPTWASYRRQSWNETGHKLIVPMFDHRGELRSVRAGLVIKSDVPKRLPPAGHRASGLVMACTIGQAMLRGTWSPERIIICEGEPDFLSASSTIGITAHARFGIASGSWSDEIAARFPDDCTVFLSLDQDSAGEKYAAMIRASIGKRCDCRAWRAAS